MLPDLSANDMGEEILHQKAGFRMLSNNGVERTSMAANMKSVGIVLNRGRASQGIEKSRRVLHSCPQRFLPAL